MGETNKKILVVDDEAPQRELLTGFVTSLGLESAAAASGEEALQLIESLQPDMVLLDVRLPGIDGIETLDRIRRQNTELPVLLITAFANLRQAVSAMKSGADDYLAKPIDLDELAVAIHEALGQVSERAAGPGSAHPQLPDGFVCESAAMQRLVETIAVVAPSDAPILITGESGTGK